MIQSRESSNASSLRPPSLKYLGVDGSAQEYDGYKKSGYDFSMMPVAVTFKIPSVMR